MPREIYPSSYECDCGHQSHFCENTVREMKAMSQKKKVYLGDSERDEHTIVFFKGKMVDIICPHQKAVNRTSVQHRNGTNTQEIRPSRHLKTR